MDHWGGLVVTIIAEVILCSQIEAKEALESSPCRSVLPSTQMPFADDVSVSRGHVVVEVEWWG